MASKPSEELDSTAKRAEAKVSGGSDKATTLKHAAVTAVAGAIVAGLAGAAKAMLERRAAEGPPPEDAEASEGRQPRDEEQVASEAARDEPEAEGRDDEQPAGGAADDQPEAEADEEQVASEAARDEPEAEGQDDEQPAGGAADDQPEAEADDGQPEAERDEPDADAGNEEQPQGEAEAGPDDDGVTGVDTREAATIVDTARQQLEQLLGSEPERVSGIERSNGHWAVDFEVVEMHRIPESTDILSSYEVVLDDDRNLVGMSRKRRYRRSQVDDE